MPSKMTDPHEARALAPRFAAGDRVRVRSDRPPGHVRTPGYIRGKSGTVLRCHGAFRNPESLAYGGDGLPKQPLYFVAFDAGHVWGGAATRDRVIVDIYDHWLERAD